MVFDIDAATVHVIDGDNLPYIASTGVIADQCGPEYLTGSESEKLVGVPYRFEENDILLTYEPSPTDKLIVDITRVYPPPIGIQHIVWNGDPEQFHLYAHAHADIRTAVERVAGRIARLLNLPLTMLRQARLPHEVGHNELAMHRLQDLGGAIGLLPPGLVGTIVSKRTSHVHEIRMAQVLFRKGLTRVSSCEIPEDVPDEVILKQRAVAL